MTKRVKLTVAAANVIMKAARWRTWATEYRVMRRVVTTDAKGKGRTSYVYAYAPDWQGHMSPLHPRDSYRDAMLDVTRMTDADRSEAVIFRIRTERPE